MSDFWIAEKNVLHVFSFKPTKNKIRRGGFNSSGSMTDKEMNAALEGRFKTPILHENIIIYKNYYK
jgi:hypothetical protein